VESEESSDSDSSRRGRSQQLKRVMSSGNNKQSRYFNSRQQRFKEICHVCGLARHINQSCPNEICLRCHLPGHISKNCKQTPVKYTCYKCQSKHDPLSCPADLSLLPDSICSNCGTLGHCNEYCKEPSCADYSAISSKYGVDYLFKFIDIHSRSLHSRAPFFRPSSLLPPPPPMPMSMLVPLPLPLPMVRPPPCFNLQFQPPPGMVQIPPPSAIPRHFIPSRGNNSNVPIMLV